MYPLVRELAVDGIPVAVTCRVLKIARQPYYRWLATPVTAAELDEAYRANALFDAHRDDPEFGYRFLVDEAADAGQTMAQRTGWRICSANKWWSSFGKKRGTKHVRSGPPVHDDLVARNFTADKRNRLWLTDITEHHTGEGKLYLCAIEDVHSNRIVGYSIDSRMKARLAVDALDSAVARRAAAGDQVAGCIVHSDRGSQFRSRKFVHALGRHAMVGSMGRVGACGDNAAMEMLLSVSSGHGRAFKQAEQVARVVPFQAAHGLAFRLPLRDSADEIRLRGCMPLGTRKDHRVQSTVELTVAATGKTVTGLRLTRCRLERCDTGEASKGRLVSAATRV